MLRRDLQVFRACQCNIVAEGELLDSSDNILNVIAAWRNRAQALKGEKLHITLFVILHTHILHPRDIRTSRSECRRTI